METSLPRRLFLGAFIKLSGIVALPPQAIAFPAAGKLLQTSPVAGFQYHAGEAVWPLLSLGIRVDLVREPANRYDRKAVRVDCNGHKLGYVPRTENHAVAQLLDRGVPLSARVEALTASRNPWARVQIAVLIDA